MAQKQEGVSEKEVINIEVCARTKSNVENVPSQGLDKEMRVVLKTLWENRSFKLSGGLGARVFPGESKEEV